MAINYKISAAALALMFATSVNAADFVWQVQSVLPETDTDYSVTLTHMKEAVEQASNGAIEMQIFPVGALVDPDIVVESVSSGAIDGGHIIAGMAANIAPSALGTEMPFGVVNAKQHHALHYGAGLIEIMRSEYAANDIQLAGIGTSGSLVFMSNKEIASSADLNGMKIFSIPNTIWLSEFGVSPTEVPGLDLYSALRLGAIDGITWTLGEIESTNLKEVVKFVMQPKLLTPGTHLIINKNRWDELPEQMRADVLMALEEAQLPSAQAYNDVDALAVAAAKDYGVKFVELDAASLTKLQAASQSFWDEVAGASPAAAKMVATYRSFLAQQ